MKPFRFSEWDEFLETHPHAHILQTSQWGMLKSEFGWKVGHVIIEGNGAQILFRRLPLGITLAYLPKGPIGDDWQKLWPLIDEKCHQENAFMLKIEPDCWEDEQAFSSEFNGFYVSNAIQPRRTLVIDLKGSESEILNRMKQKTRYNIRLAEKKEIQVRSSDDIQAFYNLIEQTGKRDAFGVHSKEYYQRAYEYFSECNRCLLLMADFKGQNLAGIMVFYTGKRAWYFYGASNELERNRMPTYLLQWQAIKWAKERGCTSYDLWGVPDEDEKILEENFEKRSDKLWGVYRFKRGFGGDLKRSAPGYDKIYNPLIYQIYIALQKVRGSNLT